MSADHAQAERLLGVDTGGTFTDFVLLENGTLRVHKVLSTPDSPERAILQGMRDLGLDVADCGTAKLRLVHGSTVATNAVLEHKGVRTAYIANQGLGDVLTIGRQARDELYALQARGRPAPVPEELCLELAVRRDAEGGLLQPLQAADVDQLVERIHALAPEAVAINLLFSFVDDSEERRLQEALEGLAFVSRSSEVLPEYREYERGIATWLNAYVGPLLQGYLERLQAALAPAPVAVMQSSGGTVSASQAARKGVHLLLSGPAGGLTGAAYVAAQSAREQLLTFDMGGTSTDVALIDGEPRLTQEGRIGYYPVAVPMVDMHTIGAGGGSIARVDSGGLLQVGPESAGAQPGPACYGQGGQLATVTDANLVLGRLRVDAFLGGAMRLDEAAAAKAVQVVADALGIGVQAAAQGIIDVANEHMAAALRVISVQRGVDPADFTLVSFGGAGGLHVCALADALAMRRALVPVHAGVLSALGMLVAPPTRELSRTQRGLLEHCDERVLAATFEELRARGEADLLGDGVPREQIRANYSADLRYAGQSFTLELPWEGADAASESFHRAHEARYGHRLQQSVELVNLRVRLRGRAAAPGLATEHSRRMAAAGVEGEMPVRARASLVAGERLSGPLLITETVATIYVAAGWQVQADDCGNLLLRRDGSA